MKRAPITFGRLAGIWFSALSVVTIAAACLWFLGTVRAQSSPMAGGWVGTCQDGRAFVMLLLRPVEAGYAGRISIGNMKVTSQPGAAVGECTVKDSAVPAHSVNITKAVVAGGLLTIDSELGQEVEMKLTGSDTAELRFVATTRDESWFAVQRMK